MFSLSYSGMVSIVFTWNFKFYIAFYNFYNYKQVILYSQTHQKKLARIDKVDERFWSLLPSDTRKDEEEIESDNGKENMEQIPLHPCFHETCTNPHPEPLEVSKWSKTYPQDPSPQPSTE